jgi:ABC-2 type transport system permease protein
VTVKRELGSDVETAVTALAQQAAIHEQVTKLGGDPASFERAVATAQPQVTNLEPPRTFSPDQLALGVIAGVLIYLSLMMNGQIVAQGVVEEKSSRVVELLLAAVRPWQLMAGKVLGIGLLGLAQMVVIAGGGAIAAVATGVLTISIAATASVVVWLVVWFVLGFFAYALVFAAAGALVSRQEDVGGVVMPPLMLVILGYVIGVSVLPSDPANGVVRVLSWLPVFSPTLMPIRVAMGGVPAWELVLAVALIVLAIPGLIWVAARIYSNAVLRTGARVKVRDAFRPL